MTFKSTQTQKDISFFNFLKTCSVQFRIFEYACKTPHKLRYFQICRICDELLTDIVESKIVSLNNSSYILISFTLQISVEIDW